MLNIYDIEVNFNKDLYEFFNWRDIDKIEMIRKIPILKVSSKIYNACLIKNIKLSKEFLTSIYNKTEVYNEKRYIKISYGCIISNEKESLGVIFNKNGYIEKLSKFVIEDELEILEIVSSLKRSIFDYTLLGKKENYSIFLREEKEVVDEIIMYLEKYREDKDRIKYLYYEWFDKKYQNDLDYYILVDDVKSCYNNKHEEFLEIIRLFV